MNRIKKGDKVLFNPGISPESMVPSVRNYIGKIGLVQSDPAPFTSEPWDIYDMAQILFEDGNTVSLLDSQLEVQEK